MNHKNNQMRNKSKSMNFIQERQSMNVLEERQVLVEPWVPLKHIPAPCMWLLKKKMIKQMELKKGDTEHPQLQAGSPLTSRTKLLLDERENSMKELAINRERIQSRLAQYFDSGSNI